MRRLVTAVALIAAFAGCDDDAIVATTLSAAPQPFLGCATVTLISTNTATAGSLATGDCTFDGRFADMFEVRLTTQTTVTIDLTSLDFSPSISVFDRTTGQLLASEGDLTFVTNVRLTAPLPPGTFVIVATSVSPGQTGTYQLALS